MKKISLLLVAVARCANLTACSTPQSSSPDPIQPDSSLSPSEPDSRPESADPAQDPFSEEAAYEEMLLTFGGVRQTDDQGAEQLVPSTVSLFYGEDWSSPEELDATRYFSWYLSMMWKEDLTQEEKEEKYKSPFGEDTGWFFPQEYYEPLVQTYFEVSTEHLRDTDIYDAEHEGYYIGGGGGKGLTPVIRLDGMEQEGELLRLHITLAYGEEYQPDEKKILTVRVGEDGGYRFESYLTETA